MERKGLLYPASSSTPDFWVELTRLTPQERARYTRLDTVSAPKTGRKARTISTGQSGGNSDSDENLQEIVGEHVWPNGKTYLYARTHKDIIRKYERRFLMRHWGSLLDDYEDLRERKKLEPFDPSSTDVAPSDRPPKGVRTPRSNKSLRSRKQSGTSSGADSDLVVDDSDEDSDAALARRTRSGKAGTQSGRRPKTRSRRASSYHSSQDESDDTQASSPVEESDIEDVGHSRRIPRGPRRQGRINQELGDIRDTASRLDEEAEDDKILRRHHLLCSKCNEGPSHTSLKRKRQSYKGRRKSDDFRMTATEALEAQGGWLTCKYCTSVSHWGCIDRNRQADILRSINAKEKVDRDPESAGSEAVARQNKRTALLPHESTDFVCGPCITPMPCMGCMNRVPAKGSVDATSSSTLLANPEDTSHPGRVSPPTPSQTEPILLFRCSHCSRPAHYSHLPSLTGNEKSSTIRKAVEYHEEWRCRDCLTWPLKVDKILGWKPSPLDASEPEHEPGQIPSFKEALPREYLVKWESKSYRRVEWVPHSFLSARFPSKTRSFLNRTSPPLELVLPTHPDVVQAKEERLATTSESNLPRPSVRVRDDMTEEEVKKLSTPPPDPDIELKIPKAWKLVDRLLEIHFRKPTRESASDGGNDGDITFVDGEMLDEEHLETWKERASRLSKRSLDITLEDAKDVAWVYMKWQDLGYEEATWDTPPMDSEGHASFEHAFTRFIKARDVVVPVLSKPEAAKRDQRRPRTEEQMQRVLPQPDWIPKPFQLKPFQLEGLTWLYNQWWNHRSCILADEMGLGKTVQIAALLGKLVEERQIYPSLIVVPNSTITNWIRELERWASHIHVVMYTGSEAARRIIRKHELYTEQRQLSFHVLVTTYETISGADFSTVIKSVPRWEVLVVDEGQRLKNDKGVAFERLLELNTVHKIMLTGTPLNNNIRELFNIMSFIDDEEFPDAAALEAKYQDLSDQNTLKELHARLRPYFLRRLKAEVMQELPPKSSVIVPISLTPLQKNMYKALLSENGVLITDNRRNVLMEIRKTMQHPFLVNPGLEKQDESLEVRKKQRIDASGKLRFLQIMLPRLKAKGHRALLFSQFAIALDIIEEFLEDEGHRYLRLDGDTPPSKRQKDMDAFNDPNSEYFIYILTTRAGGVGINLWSADTVILHDPDFNPHQDLQAIARAHRMGQTKPVLVFSLMIKGSAEEKIIQNGKKKLVLDHLIVQRMDDTGAADYQSILKFGAAALFEEDDDSAIKYSISDVDALIERVANQRDEIPAPGNENGMFSFSKIWEREGAMKEVTDDVADNAEDTRLWDELVAKAKRREISWENETAPSTGRAKRRTTRQVVYTGMDADEEKSRRKSVEQDEDFSIQDYHDSDEDVDGENEDDHTGLPFGDDLVPQPNRPSTSEYLQLLSEKTRQPLAGTPTGYDMPVDGDAPCRICNGMHLLGQCPQLQSLDVLDALSGSILASSESLQVKAAAYRAIEDQRRRIKVGVSLGIQNDSRTSNSGPSSQVQGKASSSRKHSRSLVDTAPDPAVSRHRAPKAQSSRQTQPLAPSASSS